MVASETRFVLDGFVLVLSASVLGGFRWSLTQVLLQDRKMGFDNPAATVYWLAPTMAINLAIISAAVEGWFVIVQSPFFGGFAKTLETISYLVLPGFLAFCMVISEF